MAPNLLDLADEILIEIFNNFTVSELSDVAATSTRLKTIARQVFELNHKPNCLDIDVRLPDASMDYAARRREIGTIFWSFGDLVTKLSVFFYPRTRDNNRNFLNRAVFNLMVFFCTGSLEKLELKWCQHLQQKERTIDRAAALFRNVKELILYNSDAIDASFLSDAKQLTKLNLDGYFCTDIVKFLSVDNPNLKSLSLNNVYLDLEMVDIKNAMKRHNLTEIEWASRHLDDLALVDEFPELKKLSVLECSSYDFNLILHLDKLTALHLTTNVDNRSLIEFLNTSKSDASLEELALRCGFTTDGAEFMQALARFTNLWNLSFTFYEKLENSHLENLHRLEKLRVLSIGGLITMTGDSLVLLVKHLPLLERLSLYSADHLVPIRLKKATYVKICIIYRTRSQTLMIYNFDISDDFYKYAKMKLKENFDEFKLQKYVQFISMDPGHDYYDDFNFI